MQMKYLSTPLLPGLYYHIYNRGNNRENIFIEQRNYLYFTNLYAKYIEPVADTFAYCLLRNHFHLLVRIKTEEELRTSHGSGQTLQVADQTSQVLKTCEVSSPSQAFSNLFNAYAKSINKAYHRTGSLFEERFGRIPITQDAYFAGLISYIHFNPQKHGFVEDFRVWPWSSYPALLGTGKTHLKRDEVLKFFGGREGFSDFHQRTLDDKNLFELVDEEFDHETS